MTHHHLCATLPHPDFKDSCICRGSYRRALWLTLDGKVVGVDWGVSVCRLHREHKMAIQRTGWEQEEETETRSYSWHLSSDITMRQSHQDSHYPSAVVQNIPKTNSITVHSVIASWVMIIIAASQFETAIIGDILGTTVHTQCSMDAAFSRSCWRKVNWKNDFYRGGTKWHCNHYVW